MNCERKYFKTKYIIATDYTPNASEAYQLSYRIDPTSCVASIIEDVLADNNVALLRKVYQSKYNKYVVYDYTPLCLEGFDLVLIPDTTSRNIGYCHYLIEQYANKLDELERALTV